MLRIRRLLLALPVLSCVFGGCVFGNAEPTPTPVPPTPTSTRTPVPTLTPTPLPTPTPKLGVGSAIVVGGELRARSGPTSQSEVVKTLQDKARVQIVEPVQGENWVVGDQAWVTAQPDWTGTWYRLQDGTFVYSAFVFVVDPMEPTPLDDFGPGERWIDVNVTTQQVSAMVGDRAVYSAPVSTGSPEFPSPLGTHAIEPDGRVPVAQMTSTQAGYSPEQAQYDVQRVLFTQFFDQQGDALHLNYWRPDSVFGQTATSHGCVGMQLHTAQWFWLFGAPKMRVEIHP